MVAKSITFVRVCPNELPSIELTASKHYSVDLGFASQFSEDVSGGFYPTNGMGDYTFNGDNFSSTFFNAPLESDPLFAISESNAKAIVFTNTPLGAGTMYNGSPAINGPVMSLIVESSGNLTGVNLMNKVVSNIERDLCAKVNRWDTCSYSEVINLLQPMKNLAGLMSCATDAASAIVACCSFTKKQLAIELAKVYDAQHSLAASNTSSAQKSVYATSTSATAWSAMMDKLDGTTSDKIGYVAISLLFKNTTVGVKNTEFKFHIKVSSHTNAMNFTELTTPAAQGFGSLAGAQVSGFS
tara:strand:+ start:573 stop:1466 length:894 start_codon:yes stop_codon:yes gene_type:complete